MSFTGLLGGLTEMINTGDSNSVLGYREPSRNASCYGGMEKRTTGIFIKVKEQNIFPFKYNQLLMSL